jgi:hypothetical protein
VNDDDTWINRRRVVADVGEIVVPSDQAKVVAFSVGSNFRVSGPTETDVTNMNGMVTVSSDQIYSGTRQIFVNEKLQFLQRLGRG